MKKLLLILLCLPMIGFGQDSDTSSLVLYMPNSFTPNNDGMNDTFGPKGIRIPEFKSYEFTAFNRWGEKVFTSDNINDQWDGKNIRNGNYSWIIIIEDELGKTRVKTGVVAVIN